MTMKKKFRLGFPVIAGNDEAPCGCFYLGLKKHKPRPKIFVRVPDEPELVLLDMEHPFSREFPGIETLLREATGSPEDEEPRELTLTFVGGAAGSDTLLRNGALDLQPYSAGAALQILGRLEELDGYEGAESSVLVSAAWESNRPKPLERLDWLMAKLKLAESEGAILFLCQPDLEKVKAAFDKGDASTHGLEKPHFGEWGDLETNETFERALERKCTVFPLPINESGKWKPLGHGSEGGPSFAEGFAKLLGFPLRSRVVREKKVFCAPEPDRKELLSGSPAELFRTAAQENPRLDDIGCEGEKMPGFFDTLPEKSLGNLEFLSGLAAGGDSLWCKSENRAVFLPNIIISGPTGAGKTLLAQALLVNAVSQEKCAIYLAPTRALVDEVWAKLRDMLSDEQKIKIIRSTGEYCEDDWRFASGTFDIACIVNEKANVILPLNPRTLDKIGVVVIDELHMLDEDQRGGTLDMLLAKLKRQQKNRPFPRIAAITTEFSQEDDERGLKSYLARPAADAISQVEPMVISATERPQKVRHSVLFRMGDDNVWPQDLVEFEKQQDRMLSSEEIEKRKKIYKTRIAATSSRGQSRRMTIAQKGEIIQHLTKEEEHHCLIVVGNNKDELEKLCQHVWDLRGRDEQVTGSYEDTAEEIFNLHEKCDLPQTLCDTWGRWAQKGLFLHNADMPKHLRKIVEDTFRAPRERQPAPIVFCTETLNYGVNLRADALILLSLNFPRSELESPSNTGPKHKPLSANQYHNILGRIGRFACDDKRHPEAYILLDAGDMGIGNDIDTLLAYYTAAEQTKSKAFLNSDMRAHLDGDLRALRDLPTFISFRTVMDALRMAQNERDVVRARDVENVLKDTFFFHRLKPEDREKWNGLVRKILELTGQATFKKSSKWIPAESGAGSQGNSVATLPSRGGLGGDEDGREALLKLVEQATDEESGESTYVLLEQGEALIDTGIHWKNIYPMAQWIEKFQNLGLQEPPIELLLPALLACDEILANLLRTAMRAFKDASDWLSPDKLEEWKKKVCSSLEKQFAEIGKETPEFSAHQIIAAIKEFVENTPSIQKIMVDTLGKDCKPHSALFFLSLVGVTLHWLAGEREDKWSEYTKNPAKKTSRTDVHIPPTRFEGISWAAQMCGNFFTAPQILTVNQVGELALLVLRLRKGVPVADLPLTRGNMLDAGQIRFMRNKELFADTILIHGKYPHTFEPRKDMPSGEDVFSNICRFYRDQYDMLQKKVARTGWETSLGEFMDDIFRNPDKANQETCREFARLCSRDAVGGENVRQAWDGTDPVWQYTFRAGKDALYTVSIQPRGRRECECDAVCYLPWRPNERRCEDRPIFTPGALFVLCHLFQAEEVRGVAEDFEPGKLISANMVLRKYPGKMRGMDALAILEPFSS